MPTTHKLKDYPKTKLRRDIRSYMSDGYTQAEIGELLGVNGATISYHLHNGRKKPKGGGQNV